MGSSGTATYIVPATLLSGGNSKLIVQTYAAAALQASHYRAVSYEDNIRKGVLAVPNDNSVSLSYIRRSGNLHHDYSAVFNIAMAPHGSDVAVTVTCPATMKDDLSDLNIGLGEFKPLITKDQASQDLSNICSRAVLKFVKT